MTQHSEEPRLSFLPPAKSSPDCLSYRQIAYIAAGALDKEVFAPHLSTCAACTERLNAEERAVAEDATRPLPPQLLQALHEAQQRRRRWRLPMMLIPSFSALALAALAVVHFSSFNDGNLKGETAILAAVKRDGTLIVEDSDAQALSGLRAGDQLSIHVLGKPHLMAYVQVFDEGTWKTLFRGEVPREGWLPLGLEVTEDAPTHVRIAVCDGPQGDDTLIDAMSASTCKKVALEL